MNDPMTCMTTAETAITSGFVTIAIIAFIGALIIWYCNGIG